MQDIFPVDVVFTILGEDALNIKTVNKKNRTSVKVNGFDVYQQSLRYATFFQKGTKCACCGKEGVYFKLETDKDGLNADTRKHFNLYAADGTLMTKDHIRPRRLGGIDAVDNMQTMCVDCNKAKGSIYNEPIPSVIGTDINNAENIVKFISIEDAIHFICERKRVFNSGARPGKMCRRAIQETLEFMQVLNKNIPHCNYIWTTQDLVWDGKSHT